MRALYLLFLFLTPVAHANYLLYKAPPTLITVTQASIQIFQSNNLRNALAISNAGPSIAYVQFGTITQYSGQAHTLAYQGFPVISGQTLQWVAPAPNNGAFGDSPGVANLTITEGQ